VDEPDVPGVVSLWDTKTGGYFTQFKAHSGDITTLQFDSSGSLLAVADSNGHDIHVYHLGRCQEPCWSGVGGLAVLNSVTLRCY
jgi:WD40 repeat protein